MSNDALDNIKRLRDVLNEAIAAMEEGREVKIEEKLLYGREWFEVIEFAQRDYRCVIKPREIWVNVDYGKMAWSWYLTRDRALQFAVPGREPVRFVEAPNDEP